MPVPVLMVPAAANLGPTAKKSHHIPQHHQSQSRRGAGHLKGPRSVPLLSPHTDLTTIGLAALLAARRGADENTPFDDHPYGGPDIIDTGRNIPLVQGRSLQFRAATQQQQQQRRRNLSPWPPSPHGLPPTPTFDIDDVYDQEHEMQFRKDYVPGPLADRYRENLAPWPPVPSNLPPLPLGRYRLPAAVRKTAFGGAAPSAEEVPMPDVLPDVVKLRTRDALPEARTPVLDEASLKLIPSPSELLKVANEQARANAALGLSDWISDAIWEICSVLTANDLVPSPTTNTLRRSPSFSGAIVPPPFRRFVQQTIYQVSASSASLMLSLWFIQRLPVGKTNGEVQTEMERSFRDDLLASKNEIPWRLLVLGLTLSNKWLEDNTFTTKTWHEVTGLSIASMRSIESKALALFSWILGPHPDQWLSWLRQLRRRELTTVNAIGSERDGRMTNPPTKKPFQVIDELIAEVCAAENHAEPIFAIASPDSAILDDFDSLNDTLVSSPLPSPHGLEVHLHSRAASFQEVGSADKIVEGLDLEPRPNSAPHDVHYPRRLKTPALWDPASTVLDSPQPPSKPRPMYEAIQRPFVAPPVPPAPQLQQYDDAYAAVHEHEYVYGPAGQVGIGSGAHQALVIPRYFDYTYGIGIGDGEPTSFPLRLTHENESKFHSDETSYPRHEPERSWYDTRLPRSIAESHIPSSWTAVSGMFRI